MIMLPLTDNKKKNNLEGRTLSAFRFKNYSTPISGARAHKNRQLEYERVTSIDHSPVKIIEPY